MQRRNKKQMEKERKISIQLKKDHKNKEQQQTHQRNNKNHTQWFGDRMNQSSTWPTNTKEEIIQIYEQNLNRISYYDNFTTVFTTSKKSRVAVRKNIFCLDSTGFSGIYCTHQSRKINHTKFSTQNFIAMSEEFVICTDAIPSNIFM